MGVSQDNMLVSNHVNWELCYKDFPLPEETLSGRLKALVISTIAWPLLFLFGSFMLSFGSYCYCKARWNQNKIIKILSNPESLKKYSITRIEWCKKQIESLKIQAMLDMESLKKPAETGLPIPQKKELRDYVSPELPKVYWKDFPWDQFVKTDFFQKSTFAFFTNFDKKKLIYLERNRVKICTLSRQMEVLSHQQDDELSAIKKIVEMDFIKNTFKREFSKDMVITFLPWLLPSGPYWSSKFSRSDRSTYEGNKNFLAQTDLQAYHDLVDAHNTLVRNNDFVVPHLAVTII